MNTTVRDWMTSPVVVVPPEISARNALTLMRRRGIHSLIIDLSNHNHHAYGIVTTTDIRDKIVVAGRRAEEVEVAEIMTSPIVCAKPSWTLQGAARKMQELGIHHLPVEDGGGTLVGMISVTDIFIAVEEAGWSSAS